MKFPKDLLGQVYFKKAILILTLTPSLSVVGDRMQIVDSAASRVASYIINWAGMVKLNGDFSPM